VAIRPPTPVTSEAINTRSLRVGPATPSVHIKEHRDMSDPAATGSTPRDLAALLALMPFAVTAGIVLESASADQTVGILDWTPERTTAGGVLHGGALITLADTVGALCAYLGLPPGGSTATTSSNTSLFRAVRDGQVRATARPLHRGRSNIVVQTDLVDSEGRLVAHVVQHQAVLR
jgi:uncharacterized protein (TIGR00369 family)